MAIFQWSTRFVWVVLVLQNKHFSRSAWGVCIPIPNLYQIPKYNLWLCPRREVAQWRRLKVLLGRLEQSLGFATAWLPLYLLFIYVLVNFHHRRCCSCARTCFPETLWRLLKQKRLLSILITILCLTSERNLHEFGCDVAVFSFFTDFAHRLLSRADTCTAFASCSVATRITTQSSACGLHQGHRETRLCDWL